MEQPNRPPRRRLGAEARREAILAAATRAFAAATYDQVSVGAVATAAGTSEALVHKYFDGKVGLYSDVVREQLEDLRRRQDAAHAALPPHASARDRARVVVDTSLDAVAESGAGWGSPFLTGPSEPEPVQHLRQEFRSQFIADLTARLRPAGSRRDRLALVGFLGFLSAAAQVWVEQGCPPDDRAPLVEAALGALEGSLGDWGVLRPPA